MTAQLILGALMPLPFWLWLRLHLGARSLGLPALLDVAPIAAAWLLIFAALGRPLLAGLICAVLVLALGIVNAAKRRTLDEPLVFTDTTMLTAALRHPGLYLPFLRWPVVAGVAMVASTALIMLLAVERPQDPGLIGTLALVGLALAILGFVVAPPAALIARLPLVRDPVEDTARLGPLATFALHRAVAAAERPARRAALPPRPARRSARGPAPHLVLLQMESFCDPRRLDPGAPADMLPHWDRLGATALARGRLSVPGFGANTNRTEFVVLTGITDEEMGLDRLNPYYRFARQPVTSLAWALRGAEYQSVCIHPFDPRFFGRHKVMPALGFHRFVTQEAFRDAPRIGRYVADSAVAAKVVEELYAADGPRLLHAITMQAHGPWPGRDPAATWQEHMRDADAMIGTILESLALLERPLLIAAFGDHRPSLALARGGRDTDYLIWRSDLPGDSGEYDLDALKLHRAIRAAAGLG
ncbi:MAG TPA: LTA synthase family protein [Acetobacteraceae bacterium]|nr:LTA synthase family protein [Acetobacteraceae bacterium]